MPDRDDAGEAYATEVARLAIAAGARLVRIVRLWDHWPDLPAHGDIADVLELEGGDVDAVREAVEQLAAKAEAITAVPIEDPLRFQPFPVEALPEPARQLVIRGARSIQCDPAMIAPPVIATMASAISNSRVVQLRPGWCEPSVLWVAVVAPSGTCKSPALELAIAPAEVRDGDAYRRYQEAMEEHDAEMLHHDAAVKHWQKTARNGKPAGEPPTEPEKPTCVRAVVNDVTFEALTAVLSESPRGVLAANDELAGWLGSFVRYGGSARAGGEEARWLPMHRAQSIRTDRVGRGPIRIPRAAVSIAGMIQPGVLRKALCGTDFDSGLVARFNLSMPPCPTKKWRYGHDREYPAVIAGYAEMVRLLYELDMPLDENDEPAPAVVRLTAEAEQLWASYYDEHNQEISNSDERSRAMLSKLEGGAARLALVVHLGRCASGECIDPSYIDGESMRRGIVLARWFAREAERVYARLDETDEDSENRGLKEWIARGNKNRDPLTATVNDLTHGLRKYRGKPDLAEHDLEELVQSGDGIWERNGGRPGKPTKRFRLVPTVSDPNTPADDAKKAGFGDGGCKQGE